MEFDPLANDLTEKQERYCQLAAVTSYADAYRQVYNPSPTYNYHVDVWALNKLPKIARRIRELMAADNSSVGVTREWLLRWWFYRMIYDPAEITAWAIGCCRFCHGDGHEYQWRPHEYMKALEEAESTPGAPIPDIAGGLDFDATKPPHDACPGCHGKGIGRTDIADTSKLSPMARAAFEGIKETRNGIEIKMADKDKAAENFAKLSGFDVVQVKVMADQLPEDDALDGLARNPVAAAAAYQRMLGSVH